VRNDDEMEDCDDTIFSFTTTNTRMLKNVIDSMSDLDETCNFIFSSEGMRAQILDTTKTLLLQITLHRGFFSELKCISSSRVGVCLAHFKYAIANARDNDEFTITMNTPDTIDFVHRSKTIDTVVRVNAMNIQFDELELQGSDPDIVIDMKAHGDFKTILNQMKSNTEYIHIDVTDNTFNLSMRSEMLEQKTRMNQTNDIALTKCNGNYSARYKTEWICTISKGLSAFKHTIIELYAGKPLRWYFDTKDVITVEYYVAESNYE
jgi:proliferating cell nuclear antigen PCNA